MRVYISGKIGEEVLSEATRLKFAKAEEMLRSRGFEVFNPTTSGLGSEASINARDFCTNFYMEILLLDLIQFRYCEAIYMLEDWRKSPGAMAEYYVAKAMNVQPFYQNRHDAKCHLSYTWRMSHLVEKVAPTDAERAEEDDYIEKHLKDIWLPLNFDEYEEVQ